MIVRFFLFLLFALTGIHAHAYECTQFGGVHHCTYAGLTVTDISFANAWGNWGPPQLYPSEDAAVAAINASYHPHNTYKTGYSVSGWSEDTPTPPELYFPPLGVVWSDFDSYGNVGVQTKAIEMLNKDGTATGGVWGIYKLTNNNYTCPSDTQMISDGKNAKGYPYAMCRSIKLVPKQCPSTAHPCSISTGNKFKPQED